MLVQLRSNELDRQRAAVDGRDALGGELPEHERQRADVVLVTVGQHDRLHVRGAIAQVGEVGQHEVDAQLVGRGEHQARVDDDDRPVVLDDGHVLPDLAQPAERQDAQDARGGTQTAVRRPCRSSTARISAFSSSVASTIGSRTPPTSTPIMFSAALTGVGLLVMNIVRKRSIS